MGYIDPRDYFGGSLDLSTAIDITLGWSSRARLIVVNASFPGVNLTLPPADSPFVPDGMLVYVIANVASANNFQVDDDEGDFQILLSTGEALFISKYFNGTAFRFFADERVIL